MISLPMQAGIANRGAKERSSELPMPHARKARFSGNAVGTHAWPVRTWGKQTNLFYLPKAYLSPPFFYCAYHRYQEKRLLKRPQRPLLGAGKFPGTIAGGNTQMGPGGIR